MLTRVFQRDTNIDMANDLDEMNDTCGATKTPHFRWFARLIEHHYEEIMAHASLQIALGKIEGINDKIKVIGDQAYGIPDDE